MKLEEIVTISPLDIDAAIEYTMLRRRHLEGNFKTGDFHLMVVNLFEYLRRLKTKDKRMWSGLKYDVDALGLDEKSVRNIVRTLQKRILKDVDSFYEQKECDTDQKFEIIKHTRDAMSSFRYQK